MPQEDIQPVAVSSSESLVSLDINPSVESFSSRSSSHTSSEMGYRQYIDLPPQAPLNFVSKEPMLDDVLREMAGVRDLSTMDEVKIKLSSNMMCIHDLNVFLPNLVSLNLEGSSLNSLRDLGINLRIKHLNVSRCGLRSLDGTNGVSTIVDLVADDNTIQTVGHLCNLPNLHKLSIRNNYILNVDTVSFLSLCPKLCHLDLSGNPVCGLPDYRKAIKEVVPTLQILDERVLLDPTVDEAHSFSSSEYSSSSASSNEVKPCSSEEFAELIKSHAPNKLMFGSSTKSVWNSQERSISQKDGGTLAQGIPISGNIISAARRKKTTSESANSTSCSEMDSLSSNSSHGSHTMAATVITSSASSHFGKNVEQTPRSSRRTLWESDRKISIKEATEESEKTPKTSRRTQYESDGKGSLKEVSDESGKTARTSRRTHCESDRNGSLKEASDESDNTPRTSRRVHRESNKKIALKDAYNVSDETARISSRTHYDLDGKGSRKEVFEESDKTPRTSRRTHRESNEKVALKDASNVSDETARTSRRTHRESHAKVIVKEVSGATEKICRTGRRTHRESDGSVKEPSDESSASSVRTSYKTLRVVDASVLIDSKYATSGSSGSSGRRTRRD